MDGIQSQNRLGAAGLRPLTILQVLPELNAGGVERGALEIAQAVVAAGGRALVASTGGRLEARLRSIGADSVQLPLRSKNPLTIWRNAARLARVVRDEGVDIVHARSRAPAWSAKWAAARSGARFVTTYHGTYSEGLPLKRRYNAVMADGERVIAISDFIAERIRALHRTPPERIVVVPRGADLAVFAPESVSAARAIALAQRWGVQDDPRPVVALPGRLTRWKGQTVFLDAMARLRDARGADAVLGLIIGGEHPKAGGAYTAELEAAIARLDLGRCVRLVGHCDDMAAALRLASVAVSASTEPEAFGRVSVEAQAMATPIVATAHGGAVETVADGETGFLCRPNDADAMAVAIGRALDLEPEAHRAMGRAGVERVRSRFSTASMQAATLKVYEEVAGRAFSA